jgi:hypothetical protein
LIINITRTRAPFLVLSPGLLCSVNDAVNDLLDLPGLTLAASAPELRWPCRTRPRGLGHDLYLGERCQGRLQSSADQGVAVGDQDPDGQRQWCSRVVNW